MDCCYRGGTAVLHRPSAAPVDYMDSIHIISAAKTPRGDSTKPAVAGTSRTTPFPFEIPQALVTTVTGDGGRQERSAAYAAYFSLLKGCAHGDLDNVYATGQYLEGVHNIKIELLICYSNFQV
ncbi:unnamed protein product [Sphagnum jensenii]|uniref:Uncharacterized protein n=1 Tax=Sphagnum jensenii TaxID=128206 RepID=A0ABP0VHR7_9BRYO